MTDERINQWVKIFMDEFSFAAPEILEFKLKVRIEDLADEAASEAVSEALLETGSADD